MATIRLPSSPLALALAVTLAAALPALPAAAANDGGPRPTVVRKVAPNYPEDALEKGLEGTVVVEVEIAASGEVTGARVLEGPELFRAETLYAAEQWLFEPRSEATTYTLTFNFKHPEGDEEPTELRPKVVYKAPPAYPEEARKERLEGRVVLRLAVDAEGRVTGSEVLEGPEALVPASREAVLKWRFEATGEPFSYEVTLNFRLDGDGGGESSGGQAPDGRR